MSNDKQAAQGFKTLEAHKTRWVLYQARAKNTVATRGRAKFPATRNGGKTKASRAVFRF